MSTYTTTQAAERLNRSAQWVRDNRRLLGGFRLTQGGHWLFPVERVHALQDRAQYAAQAAPRDDPRAWVDEANAL